VLLADDHDSDKTVEMEDDGSEDDTPGKKTLLSTTL
jgi:hypothetical protein